jgi:hypothetical protein
MNEPQINEQRNGGRVDIRKAFSKGTVIDKALRRAVAQAMRDHKRTGDPVAVWSWSENSSRLAIGGGDSGRGR